MVKYCIHCGKANDDQAVFCIGCGQKFSEQSQSPGQQAAQSPAVQAQAPSILTAELGPGAHGHMLTDVYLRDQAGTLLLVARKKSLLHAEYTMVDGSENVVGFIEQKTHLTHRTVSFEDAGHNVQISVQVSNVEKNRAPPSCWLEDSSGNRLGSIVFTAGMMAFTGVKPDGSVIFEASFSSGPGLTQTLSEFGHKSYAINLVDPGFTQQALLTIITALDQA
jgi:hypothetical protein